MGRSWTSGTGREARPTARIGSRYASAIVVRSCRTSVVGLLRFGRGRAWLASLAATAACSNSLGPGAVLFEEDVPDVRAYVATHLESELSTDGLFRLPAGDAAAGTGTITYARAEDLAVAWVRTVGPTATFVSTQHGHPIDWASLVLSRRSVMLAETAAAYEQVEFEPLARHVGPRYHIRFFDEHGPAVTLGVSALATNLEIDDGILVFPPSTGGEFFVAGLAMGSVLAVPPDPETAVVRALRGTKARLTAVPRLLHPLDGKGPPVARWELRLDREVEVVADLGILRSEVLYVRAEVAADGARSLVLEVPASTQPTTLTRLVPDSDEPTVIYLASDTPTQFVSVELTVAN